MDKHHKNIFDTWHVENGLLSSIFVLPEMHTHHTDTRTKVKWFVPRKESVDISDSWFTTILTMHCNNQELQSNRTRTYLHNNSQPTERTRTNSTSPKRQVVLNVTSPDLCLDIIGVLDALSVVRFVCSLCLWSRTSLFDYYRIRWDQDDNVNRDVIV